MVKTLDAIRELDAPTWHDLGSYKQTFERTLTSLAAVDAVERIWARDGSGVSYETQAIDPPGDRLASMPRGVRDRATQENTNVHPAQLGLRPLSAQRGWSA